MKPETLQVSGTDTERAYHENLGYTRFSSFASLIDVDDFISEDDLFITRDMRVGRMYQLAPLLGELFSDEEKLAVSEELARAIGTLPEGTQGQILTYVHTDVRSGIERFQATSQPEGVGHEIAESIISTQKKGAAYGFFSDVSPAMVQAAQESYEETVRDELAEHDEADDLEVKGRVGGVDRGAFPLKTDIYITISYSPSWRSKNLLKGVGDLFRAAFKQDVGEKLALRQYRKEVGPFLDSLDVFEQRLSGSGFQFFTSKKQDMVDLLYRELNPERIRMHLPPSVGNGRSISEILASKDDDPKFDVGIGKDSSASIIELNEKGWRIGDMHYAVTSVHRQPEATFPNMVGNAMSGSEGEGWACVNFKILIQSRIRAMLKIRRQVIDGQEGMGERMPLLRPDKIEMAKRADNLALAMNATNPDETETMPVLEASFHVVCKGRNKKLVHRRARELESGLWNGGFREQLRGDAFVHCTLPFQNRANATHLLGRSMPILTVNMCDMLNLYAGYSGSSDGRLLFNNTNGDIIFLDPFTEDTAAPHGLLVGGTGLGKSYLANALISRLTSQYNPKGFILDKGRSYEPQIIAAGGEYVVLVPEERDGHKPRCFNPFYIKDHDPSVARQPTSQEVEDTITTLIAMLKSGTADESGITETIPKKEQTFLMNEVLRLFKGRQPGQELTMTDFAKQMQGSDNPLGADLAERLSQYWGDGIYSQLFDGPLDIDFSKRLIGIELDLMSESPALDVLLLCIFNVIEATVKYELPVDEAKFLLIDEAHKTLAKPYLAGRVGGFYRELRKARCACTLISQSLKDFAALVTAEGNANDGILENTQHLYMLGVNSSDIALARQLFDVNDEEAATWGRSRSLPPFFSEFFYLMKTKSNKNHSGLVRLYSDPFSLIMNSTHPKDKGVRSARIKEYLDNGYDQQEATINGIRDVSQMYPYGVSYATKH